MDSKYKNRIARYEHLYDVLENNLEEWSEIEQFRVSYNLFVNALKRLNELNFILEKDHIEGPKNIEVLRTSMNEKLMPVLEILGLYADDNKKKSLKKAIAKLKDQGENEGSGYRKAVIRICEYIEKKMCNAEKSTFGIPLLLAYGINHTMIEKLRLAAENYTDACIKIAKEKEKVKKAKAEIKTILKQNDVIINKRIKIFMGVFKEADPFFYRDFIEAIMKRNKKTDENINPVINV